MTTRNAQRALARGVAALDAGRPAQAIGHLRAALELAPSDPRAASFMGCALTRAGRPGDAGPFILGAVRAAPGEPRWRLHLAEWLLAQGRPQDAEREMLGLLAHASQDSQAWAMLGDAAAAQDAPARAREAYARALDLAAGDPALTLKLARACAASGDLKAAHSLLETLRSTNSEAYYRLKADLLVVERNWPALSALAQAWRQARPTSAAALRFQAAAAFEQGDFHQAQGATRAMLALAPAGGADWAAYGQIALQANDFPEAERAFRHAAKRTPEDPELLSGRARLLTFQGRFEDAEAACRAALARDPHRADSYWLLALLTRGRFTATELEAVKRLSQSAQTPDHRAMAALALAHGLEARGEIAAACNAYDDAHAAKRAIAAREGYGYDHGESEARFARIASLFAHPPAAQAPAAGAVRPIFIFGMPRSGTTLVDAMLAGHPKVQDCGERITLGRRLAEVLRRQGDGLPSAAQQQEWARSYLAEIALRPGAALVIDKNPLNFQAAGLIAHMFPDAVLVHIRRNPVEVGLSIWRHEFAKGWTFTTSLPDIGHFYGQYARLMAHWQEVLGARLISLQYEEFAGDFSQRAAALLARIGLEWDDACGDFSRPRGPIATLTAVQLRGAVTPAAPRAPHFGAYLEPLRRALRAADVDLETGVWRGPAANAAS